MSFSESVKRQVLIDCRRHCVLCGKFCGTHIELHHIKQRAHGGEDTYENCIPLCLDCHADVGRYNDDHPKGTKYSEKELRQRRDLFYKEIKEGKHCTISEEVAEHFDEIQKILKGLFRVKQDAIGIPQECIGLLVSYDSLRNNVENCTPEQVDEIVRWLAKQGYVKTDIRKDHKGKIGGSIIITQSGIDFYEKCKNSFK